jgi:hypothetical protein
MRTLDRTSLEIDMSQIKTVEHVFADRTITDEELAEQLKSCLQHRDPILLSQIADSVVQSRFPQISSEPPQEERLSLLAFFPAWQRLGATLSVDVKTRLDSCLGLLRQRVRRH